MIQRGVVGAKYHFGGEPGLHGGAGGGRRLVPVCYGSVGASAGVVFVAAGCVGAGGAPSALGAAHAGERYVPLGWWFVPVLRLSGACLVTCGSCGPAAALGAGAETS